MYSGGRIGILGVIKGFFAEGNLSGLGIGISGRGKNVWILLFLVVLGCIIIPLGLNILIIIAS